MKTHKWIISGIAIAAFSLTSISANAQSAIKSISKEELKQASVKPDVSAESVNTQELKAAPASTNNTAQKKPSFAPVTNQSKKARFRLADKQAAKATKPKNTEAVE